MKCSGCGKSIPFNGSVWPYCQSDKVGDKRDMWAWIVAPVGVIIGAASGGPWGALAGAFVAPTIARAILCAATKKGKGWSELSKIVQVIAGAAKQRKTGGGTYLTSQ